MFFVFCLSLSIILIFTSFLLQLKIRVYQVLDCDSDVRERNRLIDIRYINHSIEGWQIFRVKKAFNGLPYWNENSKTKHFLITAVNSFGFPVKFKIRREFESDQLADYKPLLVLFNGDTTLSALVPEDTIKIKNIFPQTSQNENFSGILNYALADKYLTYNTYNY